MTLSNTANNIINKYQNSILASLFLILGVVLMVFSSLATTVFLDNMETKNSFASGIYICATGETLSSTDCLSTPITNPIYTEACPTGYTPMDSVCVTFTQKICTDYPEAVTDTAILCKIGVVNNVQYSEITDYDGRQCNGAGYNFKRYNVDLPLNSTAGAIVCAGPFSTVSGKENFRIVPQTITDIKNFITTQTGTSTPLCPTGYTLINAQCSIPAKISNCNSTGEYLTTSSTTCQPCPINSYCTNSSTGETLGNTCPNGGALTDGLCIASNKINTTTYTDGCTSAYVRFDKTCAIEEIRTHDQGCSYFYASDNVNIVAVFAADGIHCSTGGSVDFANSSILKVSDLECDGPGSGWFNYNVSYDPLVCGNSYDPANKAAFRWLEKTFTKIVGLQKLGTASTVCPNGWTVIANSNNCSQAPVVQRFALVSACPAGTFAPAGSTQASNCTSTPPATNGGGPTITITNTSSSSVPTPVPTTVVCTAKPGEYFEDKLCKPCYAGYYCPGELKAPIICPLNTYCPPSSAAPTPCPVNTYTKTIGSKVFEDCFAEIRPTIRSGGNKIDLVITLVSILSLIVGLYFSKNYHKKLAQDWTKIK